MTGFFSKILKMEEKKEFGIQAWSFLGPVFILLTLFLTSFSPVSNKDLFLLSIVAVFLCLKKRERGLFYSSLFLFILIIFKHFQITENHLWQFGLELSLFLGFIITYYSIEHASEYILSIDDKRLKVQSEIENLQLHLDKEEAFHQRQHKNFKYEMERINLQFEEKKKEIESFKNLVKNLRDTINENENERVKLLSQLKEKEHKMLILRQEIEDMKEHISMCENQEKMYQLNNDLSNKLNEIKIEYNQLQEINKSLSMRLSKEMELKNIREKENRSLFEQNNIFENQILTLQNDLSQLKEENNQILKKNENYSKLNISQTQSEMEKKLLAQYEKKYSEFKKMESLYKQLKVQFFEKNKVLDQTRQELFLTNEFLEKINKEKSLSELDETDEVKDLYLQIGEFEDEIKRLETENDNLLELVTGLMKDNHNSLNKEEETLI